MASRAFNETELIASITKDSLYEFTKEFWTVISAETPVWNWHIEYLCGELQKMAERIFKGKPREYDLIVNVSPGSTKSSIFSVMFPAWAWTRMASFKFIGASYAYTLAMDLSRKCRDVVKSEKYQKCFPDIKIRDEQDSKGFFVNTANGMRYAVGVNGSVVGMHAHMIVVDDPLDPEQAFSDAEIKIANRWMTHTLPTRKVDKAMSPLVLVQQRLHAGDPTGDMLENGKREGAFPIRHLKLPADSSFEICPPELTARYVDGLMDPVRLPWSVLKSERARNEYSYVSQYGQDPRPVGTRMFEEEYFNQTLKAAPYNCMRIRYWDRACLIGSTLVETNNGPVRIDQVVAGDEVLTRNGYRKVKKAWLTKYVNKLIKVDFDNDSSIVGTDDHLIFTNNRGWVPLVELCSGDYVPSIAREIQLCESEWDGNVHQIQNSLNSTGSFIHEGRVSGTLKQIDGISKKRNIGQIPFIGQCGEFLEETSPKGMTCITLTETGTITQLKIWSVCPELTTIENTTCFGDGMLRQKLEKKERNEWRNFGQVTKYSSNGFASFAVKSFRPDMLIQDESSTVLLNADKNQELQSIGVYDLEVEGEHEFFANGILVHNSTSVSDNPNACYTAGVLMAKDGNGMYYVEHVVTGQWEPTRRNEKMKACAIRDRVKYGKYEPIIWVEREGGSAGRDAWKGVASALAGFVVKEDSVSGKKEVRAEPWSCQLAAKNVHIVVDGTWDFRKYVDEHLLFPHNRIKDQVDASTGAFNLLSQSKKLQPMKIIRIGSSVKPQTKFVVCEQSELVNYKDDEPVLVIVIRDLGERSADPDWSGMENIIDQAEFIFPDFDPETKQDKWETKVEPYNKLPQDLVISKDYAKKIWAFVLKSRDPYATRIIIVQKDNTRMAEAVARAFADVLRLPEASILIRPGGIVEDGGYNRHVFSVVKSSRALVAG